MKMELGKLLKVFNGNLLLSALISLKMIWNTFVQVCYLKCADGGEELFGESAIPGWLSGMFYLVCLFFRTGSM